MVSFFAIRCSNDLKLNRWQLGLCLWARGAPGPVCQLLVLVATWVLAEWPSCFLEGVLEVGSPWAGRQWPAGTRAGLRGGEQPLGVTWGHCPSCTCLAASFPRLSLLPQIRQLLRNRSPIYSVWMRLCCPWCSGNLAKSTDARLLPSSTWTTLAGVDTDAAKLFAAGKHHWLGGHVNRMVPPPKLCCTASSYLPSDLRQAGLCLPSQTGRSWPTSHV